MLLVPLGLLAAGSDVALCWFVGDHYARHGHVGLPPGLALMAVALTAMTAHGAVALCRELYKGARPKQTDKIVRAANASRKRQRTKEPR